jgi:hypothetical protein
MPPTSESAAYTKSSLNPSMAPPCSTLSSAQMPTTYLPPQASPSYSKAPSPPLRLETVFPWHPKFPWPIISYIQPSHTRNNSPPCRAPSLQPPSTSHALSSSSQQRPVGAPNHRLHVPSSPQAWEYFLFAVLTVRVVLYVGREQIRQRKCSLLARSQG